MGRHRKKEEKGKEKKNIVGKERDGIFRMKGREELSAYTSIGVRVKNPGRGSPKGAFFCTRHEKETEGGGDSERISIHLSTRTVKGKLALFALGGRGQGEKSYLNTQKGKEKGEKTRAFL